MKTIEEKVRKIIDALGVTHESFEVLTDHELDMVVFSLKSDDGKLFYPRNGEALRALNHVLHKMMGPDTKESFLVDINNLQQKRIAELKGKARVVADRVRSYETSLALDPMPAYERMIVHTFLSNFNNVATESEGDGYNRHVVVKHIISTS